jgi:type II secretory pathway pseudopilin PulG
MASRTRPGDPRAGERGYTLLALVGIVTVMLIAVGAALPHWRAVVQREKEAELVARGFQYAEAIRVFQRRFGRLPNQLSEMIELDPRSLRRLYDDPMTGGPFLLLVEGPGGTIVPVDPESGEVVASPPPVPRPGEAPDAEPHTSFTGSGPIAGPIHGVKSRARGEAYRTLFDQKDYGSWEFTVERLGAAMDALGPDGLPRRLDYATIGKPFRYPPPGGIPGANPQARPQRGQPNRPRRPGQPPPGQLPREPPPPEQPDEGDGSAEE